ncbi:MAG: hypothetical protein MJ025_06790 [Victivallaceae bacterium]|nr:hypothetical protein [Victivallaceae bacterium]
MTNTSNCRGGVTFASLIILVLVVAIALLLVFFCGSGLKRLSANGVNKAQKSLAEKKAAQEQPVVFVETVDNQQAPAEAEAKPVEAAVQDAAKSEAPAANSEAPAEKPVEAQPATEAAPSPEAAPAAPQEATSDAK